MAWNTRRLMERFGVELSGQALAAELPQTERNAVYEAVTRYGVAVVKGQDLSNDDLYRFGASIGDVTELGGSAGIRPGHVATLSNLAPDGSILPRDSLVNQELRTSYVWHSDSTYVRPRDRISMLLGRIVPSGCAQTEFCDLRLAWESLSGHEQAQLDGLIALHSLMHTRSVLDLPISDDDKIRLPPVARPLVAVHEESGRRALCLGSHICGIIGMDDRAALAMVDNLTRRAAVAEHCYSHQWSPGDLLLWDNHAVMHRATPYDVGTHKRDMRALRLKDRTDG